MAQDAPQTPIAAPKRIQRQRTKGWRMPPNTVYVGRPTKFGNPFVPPYRSREHVLMDVERFRIWVTARRDLFPYRVPPSLSEIRELRGKDLACWCPLVDKDGNPVPCHADVLLELANA
jgi:hypothetical protein